MSVFDNVSQFLEERLDEYLRAHPQLELQVLVEKLREQEQATLRLQADLEAQLKRQQDAIMATAQDIQRWHQRIKKAQQAGRQDLAQAAQDREARLLHQGNQQWGQMELIKQRQQQTQELLQKIQVRRQEVQVQIRNAQAAASSTSQPPPQPPSHPPVGGTAYGEPDRLEEQFKRWEMEEELEVLKRNMGR